MSNAQFLERVRNILHPHQGINGAPAQKAMICEAYDIYITGLTREHAESRTEALNNHFIQTEEDEAQAHAKAKHEQEHGL